MIIASLADPVAGTDIVFLLNTLLLIIAFASNLLTHRYFNWWVKDIILGVPRLPANLLCILGHYCLDLQCLFVLLQFERCPLTLSLHRIRWFSDWILHRLRLLAPIAFFSSLEIVVLTHRTLPAALRKLKIAPTFLFFCRWFVICLQIRRFIDKWSSDADLGLHDLWVKLYWSGIEVGCIAPLCNWGDLWWRFILNLLINPIHVFFKFVEVEGVVVLLPDVVGRYLGPLLLPWPRRNQRLHPRLHDLWIIAARIEFLTRFTRLYLFNLFCNNLSLVN